MMLRRKALLLLLLAPLGLLAQQYDSRIAEVATPLTAVEAVKMPSLDNQALLRQEMERYRPGMAPRFAESIEVDIRPDRHGTWDQAADGDWVWRLRIGSRGAKSLNLGFTEYRMPEGGTLILYSPDRKRVMGPFTPADNEDHGQLWTPVLDGDALVLEVRVPVAKKNALRLQLSYVNHDFLGFKQVLSGRCNLDVACGSGDGWALVERYRDVIQSVGIYGFGGDQFCTGFLINNVREDCRPFFMTANHCGVSSGNAASVVIYWNFENSFCRSPNTISNGGAGDGQLDQFNTGATFRANYAPSDFTLLELDDPVDPLSEAFFAGWNRSEQAPGDTLSCVHHPNSDEKRISFAFQDAYVGKWGERDRPFEDGDHLVVPQWDVGTTEIGSSGAPLFDRNKRVVGQLHGGFAACGNNEFDQFGWFNVSWSGGRSASSSLSFWLDPDNTGVQTLDGRWQTACGAFLEIPAVLQEICASDTAYFDIGVSEGFSEPVRLNTLGLPAGLAARFETNPVLPGQRTRLIITGTEAVAAGEYSIRVEASSGSNILAEEVSLIIFESLPPPVEILNPLNGEIGTTTIVDFRWTPLSTGATYDLQLATSPDFDNILLESGSLNEARFSSFLLEPETTYYWRVRARNQCGLGSWSDPASFVTASVSCRVRTAADLPVTISESGSPTVTSEMYISNPGAIVDIRVNNLDIDHSFVGDLKATLISPQGAEVVLFDRPGEPADFFGCDGADLRVSFSDGAPRTALQLEETCGNRPAIQGNFQPLDPLSALNGEPVTGNWTLAIKDANNQDGGRLNGWSLEFCTVEPRDLSLKSQTSSYSLCLPDSLEFELEIGEDFSRNGVRLSAEGIPPNSTLTFSDSVAAPGTTVTVTLSQLNTAGFFPMQIIGEDGRDTSLLPVFLDVADSPSGVAELLQPDEAETMVDGKPALRWSAVPNAAVYRLEVARDEAFDNLFASLALQDTLYQFKDRLPDGAYYWRINASNGCGNALSGPRRFTVRSTTAVDDFLDADALIVRPNPTGGLLWLEMNESLGAGASLEIFSAEGQLILRRNPDAGARQLKVDLSGQPAGLYLLHLRTAKGRISRKVVKTQR